MKSSLIPIACSTALALMAGAAGSHWFSVRDMATLAAVLPSDMVPAKSRRISPLPLPDDGVAKEAREFIAEARREKPAPSRSVTATNPDHSSTDSRIEKLLTLLENTEEQNQELRDQIAGTNRDLQELRFQVDSYDGQFRPLKVEEEPKIYDDGSSGVLPPIEEYP
jgi:predicted RNase H-like nuclease (RuvC/YqgF family)